MDFFLKDFFIPNQESVVRLIISAAWWASIHIQYDWYGRATIFVFGLVLGYVRLKTGSIVATMCLHSLMNLIATLETVYPQA